MSNSVLYNKTFKVPFDVLKHIQSVLISNPTGDGVKRAKNIVKNGVVTYQGMKRLKNFFDYYNPNTDNKSQYELAGGDLMKSFIESKLNSERDAVRRGDKIKSNYNINPNLGVKAQQTPRINEGKKEKIEKNATSIVVGKDNRILLLKRSNYPNQWMPNKWSFIGGSVEKNENPEAACKREIFEECGLDIKDMVDLFTIKRDNTMEYIFLCKYDGDELDVQLNEEHDGYGWFTTPEIKFLDTVPHLMEYLTMTFKKYD